MKGRLKKYLSQQATAILRISHPAKEARTISSLILPHFPIYLVSAEAVATTAAISCTISHPLVPPFSLRIVSEPVSLT
jgi:hypothetical protein